MSIYFIRFTAIPTQGNELFGKAKHTFADVFVAGDDQRAAEAKARSYIMDYRLRITDVQFVHCCTEELLPRLQTKEQQHYQRAKKLGISMEVIGFPVEEHDNYFVEISSMSTPNNPDSTH